MDKRKLSSKELSATNLLRQSQKKGESLSEPISLIEVLNNVVRADKNGNLNGEILKAEDIEFAKCETSKFMYPESNIKQLQVRVRIKGLTKDIRLTLPKKFGEIKADGKISISKYFMEDYQVNVNESICVIGESMRDNRRIVFYRIVPIVDDTLEPVTSTYDDKSYLDNWEVIKKKMTTPEEYKINRTLLKYKKKEEVVDNKEEKEVKKTKKKKK